MTSSPSSTTTAAAGQTPTLSGPANTGWRRKWDLAKRRRRGPTRPNVYVTIIGAGLPVSSEAAPAPAEAEAPREADRPLVSSEWLERRNNRLDAFEQELRRRTGENQVGIEATIVEAVDRLARSHPTG